jgi:hypothetical protein
MVTKSSKPLITVLSKAEADAEPVVKDVRLQIESVKELLDKILYLAIDNKEIARDLCITTAVIASR